MILCKTASQVSVSGLPVSVSVSVEVIDGYKYITFSDLKLESVYIKKNYHILRRKENIYKKKNIYIYIYKKLISHY